MAQRAVLYDRESGIISIVIPGTQPAVYDVDAQRWILLNGEAYLYADDQATLPFDKVKLNPLAQPTGLEDPVAQAYDTLNRPDILIARAIQAAKSQ